MAGQSSDMLRWSWTEVSVLGSRVIGRALMDSCVLDVLPTRFGHLTNYLVLTFEKQGESVCLPLIGLDNLTKAVRCMGGLKCVISL